MLCGALLIAAGCSREHDPVSYAENNDNGLRKQVSVGSMLYDIQYKPAEYVARMEHLAPAGERQRARELEGMAWFNISFRVRDYNQSPLRYQVSGLEEYTARQDYYLNQAPKDIYLLYGKDTLYVSSYWFENNQNLALHETMVLGFRLPDGHRRPQQDLRLSFYDRVYRNGIIKAVIRKEDLEDVPAL